MNFSRIRHKPWRNPDLFAIVPRALQKFDPGEYDRIMASTSIGMAISRLHRCEEHYGELPFSIVDPRVSKTRDVRTDLETTSDYSYGRVDPKYFESRGTVQGHGVESINNPYQPPPPTPEPTPLPPRKENASCFKCGKDHVGHGIDSKEEFKNIMAVYGCTI